MHKVSEKYLHLYPLKNYERIPFCGFCCCLDLAEVFAVLFTGLVQYPCLQYRPLGTLVRPIALFCMRGWVYIGVLRGEMFR